MSEAARTHDDVDKYISTWSNEERKELEIAGMALDLAEILYQLRQKKGLTQQEAAERSGLKQQAISRLEKAASNMQLGTLQRYMDALGYSIEISFIDNRTGKVASKTTFPLTEVQEIEA